MNKIKTFGNIVCFRQLQKRVDNAIALFGNREAGGVVLLKGFKDYYEGYVDDKGKQKPGYIDMIEELEERFPLSEPSIIGEKNQRDFILLFGALLRMRNLLLSFDEFAGRELISERDLQTYLGRYQDLRDEWKNKKDGDKEDITKDIVFEVELIKQIEINIDYILMLVQKYKDGNCEDKEIVVDIRRAVDASHNLRSKKDLIEAFIANVNDYDDVFSDWREFVKEQKEKEITAIITEERLKADETKRFIDNAFRDGELKTTGVGIDNLLPPMRRFGGGSNRAEKKQSVTERLKAFFEKYFGII